METNHDSDRESDVPPIGVLGILDGDDLGIDRPRGVPYPLREVLGQDGRYTPLSGCDFGRGSEPVGTCVYPDLTTIGNRNR